MPATTEARHVSWADYGTHGQSAFPELWDGCVHASFPGLGPTGDRLFDLSGYSHHGAMANMEPGSDWIVGGPATDGGPGYCLSFDGSDERVVAAYGPSYVSPSVTVSCWYYRTSSSNSTNGRGLVGRYTTGRSWLLWIPDTADDRLFFITTSDGTYNSNQIAQYTTTMPNNTWYHAVGRLNAGGYAQLFVNNVLVATAASTTSGIYSPANSTIEIGSFSDGFAGTFFQGRVSSVMVWDYAIPVEYIKTLYEGGPLVACKRRRRTRGFSEAPNTTPQTFWVPPKVFSRFVR